MKSGIPRTLLKLTGAIGIAMLLASPEIYADDTSVVELQPSVTSAERKTEGEPSSERFKDILLSQEKENDSHIDPIGLSDVPRFESHGVIRTQDPKDNTTYFMLGYNTEDLLTEEGEKNDAQDNSGFSYGVGVSNDSSSIEYMMQFDQEDYRTEAIGLSFSSKF